MKSRVTICLTFCLFIGLLSLGVAIAGANKGRGSGPIIFVTSQGLYYDSILTADTLPPNGPFQRLEPLGEGLLTEFGPGDQGYVGGRWWVDLNDDNQMDPGDRYFSCPLLGPGRETP